MELTERDAGELNYSNHKKVKTRKDHYCYFSGSTIRAGSLVESIKVLPNSSLARIIGVEKPTTFYKCGRCGPCTH
jgi:hypothetical protein